MSTLATLEKERLRDLLGMSGGYVLDFSDMTFADLFKKYNIDISGRKYNQRGDSKAKRLRTFWDIESDTIVGNVLSDMLEVWLYKNPKEKNSENYQECVKIVNRLLGRKQSNKQQAQDDTTEQEFLKKDFSNISIKNVPIEATLLSILEARLSEANKCLSVNAPLAVIFLCGSILEGLLLGIASQYSTRFKGAQNAPKHKDKNVVKDIHDWSLAQLIDISSDLGFIKPDVKKFSHAMRDFRNYIHPHRQMSESFNPDEHTAKICFQVLQVAIASLSGERS